MKPLRGHFIDTNILLYSISTDPAEARKQRRAAEILDLDQGALSVQVLQEFYVQSTRQSRDAPLPHRTAVELIETWSRFHVQDLNHAVLRLALDIKGSHSLSYWDAAIVAAARVCGCQKIFSEDMSHGSSVEGVLIENPFITDSTL